MLMFAVAMVSAMTLEPHEWLARVPVSELGPYPVLDSLERVVVDQYLHRAVIHLCAK
jgi:hypothetical protein